MQIMIDIPEDVYTRLFDNGIQNNEIAVDDVCEMARAIRLGIPLPKEPCEDCISRSSIKQKLQKHRDFFTKAYSGYSYLPQNDKSRVDEITNCISMVVNEPPVAPQHYKAESEEWEYDKSYNRGHEDAMAVLEK